MSSTAHKHTASQEHELALQSILLRGQTILEGDAVIIERSKVMTDQSRMPAMVVAAIIHGNPVTPWVVWEAVWRGTDEGWRFYHGDYIYAREGLSGATAAFQHRVKKLEKQLGINRLVEGEDG